MTGESGSRSVDVRKMREGDVPAAMSILDEWDMAPEPERADAERGTLRVENSFVADDAGQVVGVSSYIVHSDTLAETASLAVDPDNRGEGVGYRLEEMRSRGIERARTETDRPSTIEWCVDRFGYERIGTTPKKHDISLRGVDEWTILELDLQQWSES